MHAAEYLKTQIKRKSEYKNTQQVQYGTIRTNQLITFTISPGNKEFIERTEL
jgi:hypothetical protein